MKKLFIFALFASLFITSCTTNDVALPDDEETDISYEITDIVFAQYLQFLNVGNMTEKDGVYTLSSKAAALVGGKLNLSKSSARISELQAAGVATADQKITNLDGIQYFINVDSIMLASNELTTLDVTALTKLVSLDMNSNFVSELNLSENTKLTYLRFNASSRTEVAKLSAIDLSNNTKLEYLSLTNHNITTINLDNNTALKDVNLSGNPGAPFTIPAAIYDQLKTKTGVLRGN